MFSNQKSTKWLKLFDVNKKLIYKEEINLEKGFQSFKIPIEYSPSLINKKNKNNFIKSDNGNYFLNKGEYILNLDQISKKFKIK